MVDIISDIRYAIRILLNQRAFTAGTVLTLGLAIGANTAIFSIVDACLLGRLPFRDPDRLVWIWATRTDRDKAFFSIPNFADHRERARTLDQMAALTPWSPNLTGTGEPERFSGMRVTANAFETLGARAAAGRLIAPSDDSPTAERVAVLGYGVWVRRFGKDPGAVGREVTLNGESYQIIGVLDPEFRIPAADAEVATVLSTRLDPRRGDRGMNFLRAFGRLRTGVTPEQAQADLDTATRELQGRYPRDNAKMTTPRVVPLAREIAGNYRPALLVLMGAVGMVLLVACANLANLMLARGAARAKEMAVRAALGATRGRIARQLMTESMVLAAAGGGLGLLAAAAATSGLAGLLPADLPRFGAGGAADGRVMWFTAAVTIAAGLLFGLAPAWHLSRGETAEDLKAAGGGSTGPRRAGRVRGAFVAAEVGLSFVLLAGLGLFLKSFERLQAVDPGFDLRGLQQFRISLPAARYASTESIETFYEKFRERLAGLPGCEVAAANALPLSGLNYRDDFLVSGAAPATEAEAPGAQSRRVSPGYFRVMRIPVLKGREFTESDNGRSRAVAVVDETLAKRFFGGRDPVGARLVVGERDLEVVGLVRAAKYFGMEDDPLPTLYTPMFQAPPEAAPFLAGGISFAVRSGAVRVTGVRPEALRRELQAVDSDVAATGIRPVEESVASQLAPRRFNLYLLGAFAGAALLLAALGLYSVVRFSVSGRRRELAIRRALGAPRGRLVGQVLSANLRPIGLGIAGGAVGAAALGPAISAMLFEVRPLDTAVYIAVALVLAASGVAAAYVPARRAAEADPLNALRGE